MQAIEFYNNLVKKLETEKDVSFRVLRNYRILRFAIFLISLFGGYLTFGKLFPFILILLGSISLFLLVLAKYTDCKIEIEILQNKIQLINAEIKALHGDFTGFSPGEKFASNNHPFSGDLDLFKPNGLFSFINRTTSNIGEKELANMLLFGNDNPKKVNEIVEELTKNITWTIQFRAVGVLNSSENTQDVSLNQILTAIIPVKSWFRIAKFSIPIIAFTFLILFNIDFISTSVFSSVILILLIPTSLELKNTNIVANQISLLENRLNVMRNQFNSLHELSNVVHDQNWITSLFDEKPKEIADELGQLIKIISRFHTRNNMVLGLAINIFFAWDIRQRLLLESWVTKNQLKWIKWELGLAKIEAYISATTIRFNYPNTIYAHIHEDENENKEMEGLTHPLLAHTFSVKNDFRLIDGQQFLILTGPNMAGKSTYLRAVGCAILFANAGFPVFASKYNYPRVQLYTSMRTTDNLTENSSYFFAELSRLRKMMDTVEQNITTVFVLLDEILKGTNSKDKEEGSYKFMEKMQRLRAEGIIATHDLSLCRLEIDNDAFYTGHFDSTIDSGELTFDYQLKKGVCQNMNASYLLKKMNLVN